MRYKHIIWDWNGTLLDDRWLCIEAINQTLTKRNMNTITDNEYVELFCFPVKDYYEKLGFDFIREPFSSLGTDFVDYYNSKFHEPMLQDGAKASLRSVLDAGLTQSILSAGKQEFLDNWIEYHGLKDNFICVLGVDDYYASGKMEIAKILISELKYDPDHMLMIGDTIHDHEVALSIGVDCILVDHGHVSKERLVSTGRVVHSGIESIMKIVLTSEN